MAETEKQHEPTQRRLREARRRGEVSFSPDIAATATFVAVVLGLWLGGTAGFGLLQELWRHATSAALLADPTARMGELLGHAQQVLLWGVIAPAAAALAGALAGSFFQVGGLMVWSRVLPDVNHLNPAQGLKRIFSTHNLFNLLKMVVKTLLLAALLYVVIRNFIPTALALGHVDAASTMAVGARTVLLVFAWAALIYALMAGVDYAHQRYEFLKQHRMSTEELQREHKDAEGDPINAGRRRAAHMEMVYAGLADRVRTASAVIHSQRVAVALQYLGEKDLPRVVARGEGEVAAQIRRFAAEALVPTESDASLAERLYDEVPLEQPIPRSLFGPVARLMRWATGLDP
ncbi:MAG: EscU/YscU/HrcU family type III secretion system export apparatus switch protein [Pseudomonadota bacterium]